MTKNKVEPSSCSHEPHDHQLRSDDVIQKTASLFHALGDPARLRLMELLYDGEHCVSELAQETNDSMSLISQRLKILFQANLITKKRSGKHIYYALADNHVITLLENAFKHIEEH
jgi:ArsR family transcriptional regulator